MSLFPMLSAVPMLPAVPMLSAVPEPAPADRRPALRFGARALSYGELAVAARSLAGRLREAADGGRVAVWATPSWRRRWPWWPRWRRAFPSSRSTPARGGPNWGTSWRTAPRS